jgi:hypothetical protein
MAPPPGIFCLEGDWERDLRLSYSVEPALQLLQSLDIATYIHRDVATRDQLWHYLTEWTKRRYDNYAVLYLAFHGDTGKVALGRDSVTLDELADHLEGRCRGRVLHFATCLTVAVDDEELKDFVRRLDATAVTGYAREIDWVDSATFEVLMLDELVRGRRTDAFARALHRDHGQMAKRLGLVAATRSKVYRGDG